MTETRPGPTGKPMAGLGWAVVGSPPRAETDPAEAHTAQRGAWSQATETAVASARPSSPRSSPKSPSAHSGSPDSSLLSRGGHVPPRASGEGGVVGPQTHGALLSSHLGSGRDMDLGACLSVLRPSGSPGLLLDMQHGQSTGMAVRARVAQSRARRMGRHAPTILSLDLPARTQADVRRQARAQPLGQSSGGSGDRSGSQQRPPHPEILKLFS